MAANIKVPKDQAEHIVLESHSPHVLSIAKPVRGTRAILVGIVLKWTQPKALHDFFFQGEPISIPQHESPVTIVVPWLCDNKVPLPITINVPTTKLSGMEYRKKLDMVFPIELGFTPTTYLIEIYGKTKEHQFIHQVHATIHLVIF